MRLRRIILPDDLTLELETLQHTKLSVNGTEIEPDRVRVFLTARSCAGTLPRLRRKGENEIVLELDYFQSQQTYDVFDGYLLRKRRGHRDAYELRQL